MCVDPHFEIMAFNVGVRRRGREERERKREREREENSEKAR